MPAPAPAAPPPAAEGAPLPPPPPAAAPPPAAPPPPASSPPSTYIEPPPPPPRDLDERPIRLRRPFVVGGELSWNGLAGLGANFSYHIIPQLALDAALGLSLTGTRVGARARFNFLTSEWTPFLGGGMSYASGFGDQVIDAQYGTDKAKMKVDGSPFAQVAGGVNYTGKEGFTFTVAIGYSFLLKDHNTTFVSGSPEAYDYAKNNLYAGGKTLSAAFGYAF